MTFLSSKKPPIDKTTSWHDNTKVSCTENKARGIFEMFKQNHGLTPLKHEALGTPFLIGSSFYFRCKGCNHFIGQFLLGARDLRDETQTHPRRKGSANQVEMRVCSCVLLFFFFEFFVENFNFWCLFFPSFSVLRRWRPFKATLEPSR